MCRVGGMRNLTPFVWAASIIVVIVVVDVVFLRHHALARLLINIAIVLLFAGVYLRWFRH